MKTQTKPSKPQQPAKEKIRAKAMFIYRDHHKEVSGLNSLLSMIANGYYTPPRGKVKLIVFPTHTAANKKLLTIKAVTTKHIYDTPAAFQIWVTDTQAFNIVRDLNERLFPGFQKSYKWAAIVTDIPLTA